jgi:hypothetical protein
MLNKFAKPELKAIEKNEHKILNKEYKEHRKNDC